MKPVQHMVFGNQGYLVGKENGTLVCGASEDVAGFDTTVTDKGIDRLRKWNKQAFPFLEEKDPFHRWAGLRPSTQDGLPLIGPLSSSDGRVVFAVGHYRNGILLSPVTAELAADFIEGKHISRLPFGILAGTVWLESVINVHEGGNPAEIDRDEVERSECCHEYRDRV